MAITGRCLPGHVRGRPGTAAAMTAGLVAAAVVSVAAWPGQAAFGATFHPAHRASHHAAHRASSAAPAVSHRGWVKYYIVKPPSGGHKEFLYEIAAETLGNGSLYLEIFNLNKGRLQPDGGRLENPAAIDPGWVLELPANASGPGLHYGPLPAGKAPAQPPPRRPARHALGGHASGSQPQAMTPGSALLAVAILLVLLMLGGLTAAVSRPAVSRRLRARTHDPSGAPASGQGRPARDARVQNPPPPPPQTARKPRPVKLKVQPGLSPPSPVTRPEMMSPVSQPGPQDTMITAAGAPPQDTATGDDDMADLDWPDYLMTGDIPPR